MPPSQPTPSSPAPLDAERMTMTGVEMIEAERERQVSAEGWTAEHDAGHDGLEMIAAAAVYCDVAMTAEMRDDAERFHRHVPRTWPWEPESFKPSNDPVRNLVKAGALIAAEIDRLNRA